jgi:DNA-binding MarR family transcriptional regulator
MRRPKKTDSLSSLQEAIKQSRPFYSRQQEAYLSILRTATELSHSTDQFLRKFGITQAQYNVLRILQGAGSEGLGRNEISERMVAVTPDMTRILDRLQIAGFIIRRRDRVDKRQSSTTITDSGKTLLRKIEGSLMRLHMTQLECLSASEINMILNSMMAIRKRVSMISESK